MSQGLKNYVLRKKYNFPKINNQDSFSKYIILPVY